MSFITALLGKNENKNKFVTAQTGRYPDMSKWELKSEVQNELTETVKCLSAELDEMLERKNRIAVIDSQLLELRPEQHYFNEYYATFKWLPKEKLNGLTSEKIFSLWLEYEHQAGLQKKPGFLKKFSILFRVNRSELNLFYLPPESVIPYLQKEFYITKEEELLAERARLKRELNNYSFDVKMEELSQNSLHLFRAALAKRYP